jgi:hypothetical protein
MNNFHQPKQNLRRSNMANFRLEGLAEGLAGKSTVEAGSIEEVFRMIPTLGQIKGKIKVKGNVLSSLVACDG